MIKPKIIIDEIIYKDPYDPKEKTFPVFVINGAHKAPSRKGAYVVLDASNDISNAGTKKDHGYRSSVHLAKRYRLGGKSVTTTQR
jgi:hypothetical protein